MTRITYSTFYNGGCESGKTVTELQYIGFYGRRRLNERLWIRRNSLISPKQQQQKAAKYLPTDTLTIMQWNRLKILPNSVLKSRNRAVCIIHCQLFAWGRIWKQPWVCNKWDPAKKSIYSAERTKEGSSFAGLHCLFTVIRFVMWTLLRMI